MKPDLLRALAAENPSISIADFEDLLTLFEALTNSDAAALLQRRLAVQVLRAVEVAMLSDPIILDVALNLNLYLGREGTTLRERVEHLLGHEVPDETVRHLRSLVLSGAAGADRKVGLGAFERQVFEAYREDTEELRCFDCGYHFTDDDLGERRREFAHDLRFRLASERGARRLRDEWKPASRTSLTLDHIVPEAGFGQTEVDNLRVMCKFCNSEKQIYRWSGESSGRDVASALLALGDLQRGLWAVRAATYIAIREAGACSLCNKSVRETELTATTGTARGRGASTPWSMHAACYDCFDPAA